MEFRTQPYEALKFQLDAAAEYLLAVQERIHKMQDEMLAYLKERAKTQPIDTVDLTSRNTEIDRLVKRMYEVESERLNLWHVYHRSL